MLRGCLSNDLCCKRHVEKQLSSVSGLFYTFRCTRNRFHFYDDRAAESFYVIKMLTFQEFCQFLNCYVLIVSSYSMQ